MSLLEFLISDASDPAAQQAGDTDISVATDAELAEFKKKQLENLKLQQ
ncbi:hypothetical protein OG462_42755 [Streptomyces sp. NBC_01077]|nr:hypothetical protein OG462_02270 [Streptomyces sp. NBC_01077]WSV43543.1 hypothetical protein OG462_42755 [Streptomyces sp. NBC_01077]